MTMLLIITEDNALWEQFTEWFGNVARAHSLADAAPYWEPERQPPFITIIDEVADAHKTALRRVWSQIGERGILIRLVSDEAGLEAALAVGVTDVMIKPLHPVWTRHRIDQIMRWVTQYRELQARMTYLMPNGGNGGAAANVNLPDLIEEPSNLSEPLATILRKEQELTLLKQRFMTMAAHEFRTPLTVIASASEMLMEFGGNMSPEEQQKYLASIRDRVHHLKRTLSEIERLIQADFQSLEINLTWVDVIALCEDAIAALRNHPRYEHEIILTRVEDACLGQFDYDKIRYVVDELLTNAMKFSPPNQPIELEAHCEDNTVYLTVTDHGIGVPSQEQRRLFELFFQGSNIGAIGGKGRGTGLKLARDYIQAHHGTIQISSAQNQGTVVTVMLPLRRTQHVR